MSNADANYARLSFKPEAAFNETPAAGLSLKNLPFTKETLVYDKLDETSAEVRSDRNIQDIVEIGGDSKGSIDFELSDYAEWFDTFLTAALMADTVGTHTDVALPDDGLVVAQVSAAESAFGPGMIPNLPLGRAAVFKNLFSPTNTYAPTVAVKRTLTDPDNNFFQLNVRPALGGTGSIADVATMSYKEIKNGKTKRSFFIEKYFSDLAQNIGYAGMSIDELSLDISSRKLITGSMSFIGAKAYQTGGFTVSTRTDTSGNVLSASTNVGAIQFGNLSVDVKNLKLSIKNNLRGQDSIGNKSNTGVGSGVCEVTGSLEAYFSSMALYDAVIAHDTVSLIVGVVLGKYVLAFYLPAIKLKGNPNITGGNSDIMLPLEFKAKRDPDEGASIIVSTGIIA